MIDRYPLILFDGVCNLCERWVQFVLRNDSKKQFRFAALQSDVAATILQKHSYSYDELSSQLLIVDDQLYRESRAALEVARRLDWPWPLFYYCFSWVPAVITDGIYRFVGDRRYRWFGKKEQCWLPEPELVARFIDQE